MEHEIQENGGQVVLTENKSQVKFRINRPFIFLGISPFPTLRVTPAGQRLTYAIFRTFEEELVWLVKQGA